MKPATKANGQPARPTARIGASRYHHQRLTQRLENTKAHNKSIEKNVLARYTTITYKLMGVLSSICVFGIAEYMRDTGPKP